MSLYLVLYHKNQNRLTQQNYTPYCYRICCSATSFAILFLFFVVCDEPPKEIGVTVNATSGLLEDVYVEGDNITYSCTGNGETDHDVISVCKDDGQWSLQTLPSCCK